MGFNSGFKGLSRHRHKRCEITAGVYWNAFGPEYYRDPFSINSAMTKTSGDPASRLSDWLCCFAFTESSILGPESGYCA